VQGTAFQARVWRALQRVPLGATVSYGELARRLRTPAAVRAVGTACGANRIAVLIPCHRALRADGSPGGYRWGLDRKARLLAAEQVPAAAQDSRSGAGKTN
jgi:AraC family transcriptional regulator of adaptative response/methylated-DNA-[protein]-cysteine methyltransferase